MIDNNLRKELAGFMYAFEQVFSEDWNYSQISMRIREFDLKEDFLVYDNYPDWSAHNALVTHYFRLKKEMAAQNISIDDLE